MEVADIELWGGIECTVNRVGDTVFDQVERTGHATRIDDLDRLAALGVKAVRYPILWERTARAGLGEFDFSWADARMQRLRELGIRVIVGLVHHGSGPFGTSLLEDSFALGLARFARAVAQRYPWVQDYTPVNEPLTTARFSALYGHWYPHARDSTAFLRALLIQTRATHSAMRSVREVVPNARLIQTEDFGTIFCTPKLKYQADFENHRKWLSLDLLFGRVTAQHPLYRYLRKHGVAQKELRQLAAEPCAPDIIGVNYYVTSDRFLDERVSRYPSSVIGTNGRDNYVDIEAVRARRKGIVGHKEVLMAAWARYHTALAITEVHLGCTPEEQVRWLHEAWHGAREAHGAGADIRGVTLWSIFGAYDWDSLATLPRGHYESGAFDVRGPVPRPTALAHLARSLSDTGNCHHPLLETAGWWRSAGRFTHPPPQDRKRPRTASLSVRPVLITGAGGALAEVFRRVCAERGIVAHALARADLDIADPAAVEAALKSIRPWLVVNAAGVPWSRMGADDAGVCFRENVEGARLLGRACPNHECKLITFSSALVFDGMKDEPYVESDSMNPASILGLSHASAERLVTVVDPEALIIRAGTLFDSIPTSGRLWDVLRKLAKGESVLASQESYWSLAFAPELAHTCLDLAMAQVSGIVHLAHGGVCSIFDFMRHFARAMGVDSACLVPVSHSQCRIWPSLQQRATLASERVPPLSDMAACLERSSQVARAQRIQLIAGRAA